MLFDLYFCYIKLIVAHNIGARRGYHSISLRRIQQLEEKANAEENNPRAQAEYLKVGTFRFILGDLQSLFQRVYVNENYILILLFLIMIMIVTLMT